MKGWPKTIRVMLSASHGASTNQFLIEDASQVVKERKENASHQRQMNQRRELNVTCDYPQVKSRSDLKNSLVAISSSFSSA